MSTVLVLIAIVAPASVRAAQSHVFSTAFGSPGSEAGQLSLQATKLDFPAHAGSGIAINNENGDVYVADSANHRIDEFSSTGSFVRAFGWEVDAEHPEAQLQLCTTATGCQAGSPGTQPGRLGSPTFLAVDNDPASPSHGDLYVADGVGVEHQSERQQLAIHNATGGTFTLGFEGKTTEPIPYDAGDEEIREALEALSTIGIGNVFVFNHGTIEFGRALGDADVPLITAQGSGLSGAGATVEVSLVYQGVPFAPEVVTKFDPEGDLIESWGQSGQLAETPTLSTATGTLATGSAIGTGTLSGSATITNVNTKSGTFEAGQAIEGEGIPFQTCIVAVGAGTLTVSKPTGHATGTTLRSNPSCVTGLHVKSGAFEAGQTISGPGIVPGTEVRNVDSNVLVLSREVTSGGSGVALSANRRFLSGERFLGITVDRTGRLGVAGTESVFLFGQAGDLEETITLESAGGPTPVGLGIDSAGAFYLPSSAGGVGGIRKLNPSGHELGLVAAPESKPAAFAIAPSTGDLYLDPQGSSVQDITHQCEPSHTGCAPAQNFGASHLDEAAGLALSPDGTLYLANVGASQVAVFKVSLESNVEAASEVEGTSAVLRGTINPRGGEVTACRFQYGLSEAYGESLPCLDGSGQEVGTESHPLTGFSPVALHASLEGLHGGTTYHYRLRARNAAGEEIQSEDEAVGTLVLPRVEAEETTEITPTSATARAKINPLGLAVTSCEVEWGTSIAYGHSVPCEPPGLVAGSEPLPISGHLTGLSADTTYHWRVSASDANGTQLSPDNTFVFLSEPPSHYVTQNCENESLREANGSTALPDCRSYEQVTPPSRNGALIYTTANTRIYGVAADGSRLTSPALQCFGDPGSCMPANEPIGVSYEFSRGASGWRPSPITLPAAQFTSGSLLLEDADTGLSLFGAKPPNPPAGNGRELFYARQAGGVLEPIGPVAADPGYFRGYFPNMLLGTADLSHLVYEPSAKENGGHPFWPFDQTTEGNSLFEYAGASGEPLLVAVSGGEHNIGSSDHNTELIGTCGARIPTPPSSFSAAVTALSEDGRTVYFEVEKCAGGSGQNAGVEVPADTLYARIDGEGPEARTVKISAPAPEPQCDSACQAQPAARAIFAGASADGSMAYFLSAGKLTDDASRGGASLGCSAETTGSGCNLYLFRDPQEQPLTGDHLLDVSAGDTSGQGPQAQGVMAMSQDGRRVYFVAKGLLAGANAEGNEPVEGADNLYVFDAEEEVTRFIASLPGRAGEITEWIGIGGDNTHGANVTPDGRFLLFTSHGGLTPDATRVEGPEQVYRYDAQAERLTRVSIGQRGFADNGNAGGADAAIVSSGLKVSRKIGRPPFDPSISADGARAFFESPVALTPAALNEVPVNAQGNLAENVYEWEENGAGSCDEAGGCLYLISDGRDATEGPGAASLSSVVLIGTDATGENVFFSTADPLVPTDTDTERDIYDARALGGFAPPAETPSCETSDGCHPGISEGGSSLAAASESFSGPEEGPRHPRSSKRCRGGFVPRHGRCVRHRKAHRRHHAPKGGAR